MRVIGGKTKAFALPVVLTSSLVMMLLLMVVLSGVSSSSVVLRDQYLRKLADEAAESGVNFMAGCISKNTIPPSGTFTPDSTSCLNAAVDTNKSPYVMTNGNIRTRFSVSAPVLTNGIYTISSTGYTDQTRTSSGTVSQTSSSSVKSRAFSYAQSYGVIQDNLSRTPYVLMPNGSVYSWGDNTYGQVGRGVTGGSVSTPTKIFSGIASTIRPSPNNSTFIITNAGELYAWGQNANGEIGDGTTSVVNSPKLIPVGSGGRVIDFCVNYNTSYALKDDGSVWAWGENTSYGQVGNNTTVNQYSPVQVIAPSGTNPVVKLVNLRNNFIGRAMYVIRQDGSVLAWGRNNYGQIGNGTSNNQLTPIQIISSATPVSDIVSSGTGGISVVARLQNGTLLRWGWGVAASPAYTLTPTAIPGITNISSLVPTAVGTVYAISTTGKLYAWGVNTSGNVGNGTTTSPVYTPYDVFPSGPAIVDVVSTKGSSVSTTIALASDNSVYTWGRNTNCQIGDGTTTQRLSPYNVIPAYSASAVVPKVYAINTAGDFSFGSINGTVYTLKADGTVWSWGYNGSYGLVGNNSTVDQCTPVQVLTNAVSGSAPAYFVKQDKTIWSWGDNAYGNLGRAGSTMVPLQVTLPSAPLLMF